MASDIDKTVFLSRDVLFVGREFPLSDGLVLDMLGGLGIEYKVYEHEAVYTVEESREVTGHFPGAHTKNLFIKDKKGSHWLVTVRDTAQMELKMLKVCLGAKSSLSFVGEDVLYEKLGVRPGSVTPLSLVNCRNRDVGMVLDGSLFEEEWVNVHPLRNDRTVALSPTDLLNFLRFCGCAVTLLFCSHDTKG